MSQWTAASDVDYDIECGNGDLWDNDVPVERLEEVDPETEHWLDTHGYFDAPTDDEIDRMYAANQAEAARNAEKNLDQTAIASATSERLYEAIVAFGDAHGLTFHEVILCIVDTENARNKIDPQVILG